MILLILLLNIHLQYKITKIEQPLNLMKELEVELEALRVAGEKR